MKTQASLDKMLSFKGYISGPEPLGAKHSSVIDYIFLRIAVCSDLIKSLSKHENITYQMKTLPI